LTATIAVIVSAYDNARALDFTLLAYRLQSEAPAELIVAEDSEFDAVAEVIERHRPLAAFPIRHVRQPDQGFRKCRILNRAIAEARSDFLVFTDADCVPRADVLAAFARLARPGRFVAAGSHVNLPPAFHLERLTAAMIESQAIFDAAFLRRAGVRVPALRLLPGGPLAQTLDVLTLRNAFVGNLSGAWRADLLRVGGFDEAMGYGAEDRNLGIRLNHAGVRGFRARHSLVCLHLDHPRSYKHDDEMARNQAFNRSLAASRSTVLPRESLLLPARAQAPAPVDAQAEEATR
jgi:cellulose synthase/poly-beta-1,6-N-acetylglucosamine synthase-like glycosyltransferase